jgi:hypothetical protein
MRPCFYAAIRYRANRAPSAIASASSGNGMVPPGRTSIRGFRRAIFSRRAPHAAALRYSRAMALWFSSAPVLAPPRSWQCCTHWPPGDRRERSGGFTGPATAASIRLQRRLVCFRVLAAGRSQICYSAPQSSDRPAVDFDRVGRVGVRLFDELGIPRDADFYICGPAAFITGLVADLTGPGRRP